MRRYAQTMEVCMVLDEFYKLNNNQRIPKVALGTWQTPNDVAKEAVVAAIEAGYRHIDTAIAYGNEQGVGEGVRAALESTGLHRENIFITSKIPAEVKSYKEAEKNILESFERLSCRHVDLMLIHAPKPWSEMNDPKVTKDYYGENIAVWKAMEEAYAAGRFRAIGVSNFEIEDLDNIMGECRVMPSVNQIRVHIGHVPTELIEYCNTNGILVEAYSPNATGRLMEVPAVCAIAKKYGVSVPQLASRFLLQLGLLPLPKSANPDRIRQNADLDFEINLDDMGELLGIEGL